MSGCMVRTYNPRSLNANVEFPNQKLMPAADPQAWGKAGARPGDLPTGVIVGTIEITGCRRDEGLRGRAETRGSATWVMDIV
jgi:hypothetical protein